MTTNIEIICECGTTTERKRTLLQSNIGAVLKCHVCNKGYESQAILSKEKFGIADYREKVNG